MKSTLQRLEEIQQTGFRLDFEEIIKQAFENYKKIALTIGALLLVLIVIFTIFLGGVVSTTFGIENLTEKLNEFDYSEFSFLILITFFSIRVIGTAMLAPLTAGFLKVSKNAFRNEHFGFSTVFGFYKSKYFRDIFIASLVIAIVTNILDLMVNFYVVNNREEEVFIGVLQLGAGAFSGLIGLFTFLTIPLIVFGNLDAKEAIKGSISVVSKRFWIILALVLVSAFCSIIFGLVACCIGIFFTLPFMYSLQYIMYREIFEMDENPIEHDEEIDILD